jgi:hypothetical protein
MAVIFEAPRPGADGKPRERKARLVHEPDTPKGSNGFDAASQEQRNCAIRLDDFNAYMPQHAYIFTPAREMWPAASVNARISPVSFFDKEGKQKTMSASMWLDKNKPVEQMTWAPGEPMLIPNRLISDGGWIKRMGVTCFNLYRPPLLQQGNPDESGPWLTHVNNIFPNDSAHVIKWLAHRVQRPQEKINHALVLGGNQGIGKDTLLEPVKRAIGP